MILNRKCFYRQKKYERILIKPCYVERVILLDILQYLSFIIIKTTVIFIKYFFAFLYLQRIICSNIIKKIL